MRTSEHVPPKSRIHGRRPAIGVALAAAAVCAALAVQSAPAYAATATVGLGTSAPYSVLGGQAVTNTGPTTLSGDLGVSPGTAITGFPPGLASGATHASDAVAAQAQADLTIGYDDAAGRAPTASIAGDLVGQTLTDGVYASSGPIAVSGTLTFDGQGNPASVFIVQVASTLITASASHIATINGAQACHIFWQVGSSATLGTASTFQGTIMALTSISVTTGVQVAGRALARNGQVSLDSDVFTSADCAVVPPPTTTPATTAPATTAPATTAPATTAPASTALTSDAAAARAAAARAALRSAAAKQAQVEAASASASSAAARAAARAALGLTSDTATSTAENLANTGTTHIGTTGAVAAALLVGGAGLLGASRRRSGTRRH